MKVRVVGSSGTFPAPGRPASGYLVEHKGTHIWCDAGPGTFMSLTVDSDLIDAVVVSHQHPDHCADLAAAYHAWTYRPNPREPVPLYAPASVWERLVAFIDREPSCFEFHEVWAGDRVDVGEISIDFVEMDHSVPTVGSRWVGDNRALFFTADTGAGGTWREAAEGADLLLSEASFQGEPDEKPASHHLTASEAADIAREVGVNRLILTHIPPYLDPSLSVAEAEAVFDRPVALAVPGADFDV